MAVNTNDFEDFYKKMQDTAGQWNKDWNKPVIGHPCPTCGRCPTCGKGGDYHNPVHVPWTITCSFTGGGIDPQNS